MNSKPYIRAAKESDCDAICALLHTKMNKKIMPQTWRNLMTYEWLTNKPDLGRVIVNNDNILGYLGMVYADRNINNQDESVVNICAWYLDKSLRGLGLGKQIMLDATNNPERTYTILTSSKNTLEILNSVGYKILDAQRYVWQKQQDNQNKLKLITKIDTIRSELSSQQCKLLDDFLPFCVTPVLAVSQSRQCLMFFSIKRKAKDVTYYDLLYSSDKTFIAENGQSLANILLPPQSAVLAVDCRFVHGHAIDAQLENLPVARYYKSRRLKPDDIDHLYTELQLLDLKLD